MGANLFRFRNPRASLNSCPENCCGPRQEGHKQHREIIPEGLDVLEFGGEVALEIVFEDEDAEEIGVAASAEDVPGESGKAERCDRGGMKEAEGVAPALGDERPEKNGASAENNGRRAFCEDGEAEEETEENEGEPWCPREDRWVFVSRKAQDDGGADPSNREQRAGRHVGR